MLSLLLRLSQLDSPRSGELLVDLRLGSRASSRNSAHAAAVSTLQAASSVVSREPLDLMALSTAEAVQPRRRNAMQSGHQEDAHRKLALLVVLDRIVEAKYSVRRQGD
eukprot:599218-Pleurochrysis_carterae.AAC.1